MKQKQKLTTQSIYQQADEFKDKLSLLKIYIKRAKLDVPLLKEIINALRNRNIEKVIKKTREILPFLIENKSKIKDMSDDFLDDIPTIITEFENKNTQQNILISRSKQTTYNRRNQMYKKNWVMNSHFGLEKNYKK